VSESSSAATQQRTERDQFWLDHNAAQAASGLTAKEYAANESLSLHALYQSRKRLRALGLLAPARDGAKPKKKRDRSKPMSFSKIEVAPVVTDSRFRLELPGGMALEWAGGDVPKSVADLLERLARLACCVPPKTSRCICVAKSSTSGSRSTVSLPWSKTTSA
jgi:hypothetical protein